jgi:hypothetical protein
MYGQTNIKCIVRLRNDFTELNSKILYELIKMNQNVNSKMTLSFEILIEDGQTKKSVHQMEFSTQLKYWIIDRFNNSKNNI